MSKKGNTNAKGNKGGGRFSLYKSEYAEQAENYALLGVTDAQLAKFFKVTEPTINTWKRKFPEFLLALKKGKDMADSSVAKSLYQRAVGYEHSETKVFLFKGKPVKVEIKKHVPPEPVACIYWLNNRQPDKWKNRWEADTSKAMTVRIIDDGDNGK